MNTGHTSGGEFPPIHRVWQTEQSTYINNERLYSAPCQGQINSWPFPMSLWIEPENTAHPMTTHYRELKLILVFLFWNFFFKLLS